MKIIFPVIAQFLFHSDFYILRKYKVNWTLLFAILYWSADVDLRGVIYILVCALNGLLPIEGADYGLGPISPKLLIWLPNWGRIWSSIGLGPIEGAGYGITCWSTALSECSWHVSYFSLVVAQLRVQIIVFGPNPFYNVLVPLSVKGTYCKLEKLVYLLKTTLLYLFRCLVDDLGGYCFVMF